MTWSPPLSVTTQLQSLAMAGYSLTGSSFIVCLYKGKGGCMEKRKLTWSKADKAGHESPGEDCGLPHQTVGVNRRFPVWLCPRQMQSL